MNLETRRTRGGCAAAHRHAGGRRGRAAQVAPGASAAHHRQGGRRPDRGRGRPRRRPGPARSRSRAAAGLAAGTVGPRLGQRFRQRLVGAAGLAGCADLPAVPLCRPRDPSLPPGLPRRRSVGGHDARPAPAAGHGPVPGTLLGGGSRTRPRRAHHVRLRLRDRGCRPRRADQARPGTHVDPSAPAQGGVGGAGLVPRRPKLGGDPGRTGRGRVVDDGRASAAGQLRDHHALPRTRSRLRPGTTSTSTPTTSGIWAGGPHSRSTRNGHPTPSGWPSSR